MSIPPTYYVGIGASAGGLEAIESFFKNMPSESGLAFVVIQHLSPDYKSMMAELLSKHTVMPVHRAEDGMRVQANHVYLIPPKKNLSIFHGKLLLSDQEHNRGINLPIDLFMRSLAEDQGEKTIAVILSGTGSDGTRGIRAIKEAGGMVMVQDEETAKFDGMPKSAIATGLADFILSPAEMPQQLLSFVKHPYAAKTDIPDTMLSDEDGMTRIFALLRERSKVDFTFYKPSTVVRRIGRRMSIKQINELRDYVKYLERYPGEVATLYQELLIGVTNFFRDKDVWDYLAEHLLAELFANKEGREVRLWSAGCSTGEEAYTLAILCREVMESLGKACDVKVFATDVDRDAVQMAGNGVYPEGIAADLPAHLLTKYFYRKDDSYHIARNIREMVVFAQHNLLKDPPFTNIDLVSCRNLLIYLQPVLQRKALDLFSFSLNEGGVLVLGTSESVGDAGDQYDMVHQKLKLFRSRGRRNLMRGEQLAPFDATARMMRPRMLSLGQAGLRGYEEERVLDRLVRGLLGDYVPLTLVVNEALELVHLVGDSEGYFRLPSGKLTNDVTKMAHKDLAIPVATGLQKAFKERKELTYSNIHVRRDDKTDLVQMHIRPLPEKKGQESLVAILIEPSPAAAEAGHRAAATFDLDREAEQRIQDLEQELQFTRENLQATVEELETSNEELQATNEELLASNEELQSTNEELQSVNEELYTVNAEYQSKINELTDLNGDLDNLLASSHVATIFLDEKLRVRRFTPPVARVFHIMHSDLGRPLEHVNHQLLLVDLVEKARQVLEKGIDIEQEVDCQDGSAYYMQLTPYHASGSHRSGVVLNLVDITPTRRAMIELRRNEQRYALAMQAAVQGSWDWDILTGALDWSAQIESMFGLAEGAWAGTYEAFMQAVHPEDRDFVQRSVDMAVENDVPYDIEHRIVWPDGSVRWMAEKGRVFRDEHGRPLRMMGVVRDVTEHKRAEHALQAAREELQNSRETIDGILRSAPVGIGLVRDRTFVWVNDAMLAMVGFDRTELVGHSSRVIYPSDEDFDYVGREKYAQISRHGTGTVETRWRTADGRVFEVLLTSTPLNVDDLSEGVIFTAVDLAEHRQLGERNKELWGLLDVMAQMHRFDLPEDQMYPALAERLVRVCRYPEVAAVRIKVGRRQWASPGFAESGWCLTEPIRWRGRKLGQIELVYLEDRPAFDEAAFLPEERQTVASVAACLGPHITLRKSAG
ncbi:MAG: chemotaxis protein CheB [Pseudomonadota bacterium]